MNPISSTRGVSVLVALVLVSLAGCLGGGDPPPAGLCAGVVCTAADQCHQAGVCDPQTGACANPPKANGAACTDGNGCTQTDACQAGVCVGADPRTCAAADQCHDAGVCDPQSGACSNPPKANGAACTDGNGCTQTDACTAGVCIGSNPKTCAPTQCHLAGVCDPQTGNCSNPNAANGTTCDDANPSTVGDACSGGVCTGPLLHTCAEIRAAFPLATPPDGVYVIDLGGVPTSVYCDMTTDGGGWQALFIGTNGSTHVFDHFDVGAYTGLHADPTAADYLRRAPPAIGDTASEVAVSCGNAMVRFPATQPLMRYFASGLQLGWTKITPTLIRGTVANLPDSLYTGIGADGGFIFSRAQAGLANTFGSSYAGNTSYDHCNGVADTTSRLMVYWRPAAATPVRNAAAQAGRSCRTILDAGQAAGDGQYWIDPAGDGTTLRLAYCNMTTDGGGWTAVYANRNGSLHWFDAFDNAAYTGTCTDPASHCLRRATAQVGDAATELAVGCGTSMVRFPMTRPLRNWLVLGSRAPGWTPITATVIAGNVVNRPDTFYTGRAAGDESFIVARGQGAGGNTFASSYAGDSAYDYCSGTFDQASMVRLYYREAAPAPIRNQASAARATCRAIQLAGESAGDGRYYLASPPANPYLAYCDMTTDGGGWTAIFAGRNGSTNRFDAFDATTYAGTCTDPASHCLRRAPTATGSSATELAVACGTAMVRFPMTEPARKLFTSGVAGNWTPITATAIAGTVANLPNTLYAGAGPGTESFILARNQGGGGNTFASSFLANEAYDYCNGTFDQASMMRIYFREVAPTPVYNAPETARDSCLDLHLANPAAASGNYWLNVPVGGPQLRYCDMTTDGGGWTTIFAGRNGSVNVFDHFDTTVTGTCTDPSTRCLAFANPAARLRAGELAVSCGSAAVAFPITNGAWSWFGLGHQSDWVDLSPRVIAGAGTFVNIPNSLWTGNGANTSFIFARNRASQGNTFASSYSENSSFDYCANTADQASIVRVSYREVAATPVRNQPASVRPSCAAILQAGEASGDGLYWLNEGVGASYLAYCDMTTDGGGWTTVIANRNGSAHAFGAIESAGFVASCTDPATRCLRRAPASAATATQLGVRCGNAMVRFPLGAANSSLRGWLTAGIPAGWIDQASTVVSGNVFNVPDSLWTGDGSDPSFVVARGHASGGNGFASSYATNTVWDYCAGVADTTSFVRVQYR